MSNVSFQATCVLMGKNETEALKPYKKQLIAYTVKSSKQLFCNGYDARMITFECHFVLKCSGIQPQKQVEAFCHANDFELNLNSLNITY